MSFIAKKVGRKVLSNRVAEIEPQDPHYESYQDAKGRQRKRKRAMPIGLSKRDERVLRSVRRRAHYLDKGFSLCGFRFGWTAVLGLIPGAGDIAQFLLGFFLVLKKCREAELPASLSSRMTFNQLIGLGIGLVPLVGDIGMAAFKANSRNAALLEDFLIRRASSGTSTVATPAEEEAMAKQAIEQARITKRTGEPQENEAEGRAAAAREAELREQQGGVAAGGGVGGGGKKYYGWGKGGTNDVATESTSTYGSTGTTTPTPATTSTTGVTR